MYLASKIILSKKQFYKIILKNPIKISKIPDKKFQNLSEIELDIIIFFPKKIPALIKSSWKIGTNIGKNKEGNPKEELLIPTQIESNERAKAR